MKKFNRGLVALVWTALLSPLATAQVSRDDLPKTGTAEGIIERIETDTLGLSSVWFKVGGRMHEFYRLKPMRIVGGSEAEIGSGQRVYVEFKNREHSEMDDFFTAEATLIRILKKGRVKQPT